MLFSAVAVMSSKCVVLHAVFTDETVASVTEVVVTNHFATMEAWPKELWNEPFPYVFYGDVPLLGVSLMKLSFISEFQSQVAQSPSSLRANSLLKVS
jgi:hypothetical protein